MCIAVQQKNLDLDNRQNIYIAQNTSIYDQKLYRKE